MAIVNEYFLDLIKAEEQLLRKFGWTKVKDCSAIFSIWTNPKYEIEYSRNHAILLVKAECVDFNG